MLIICVRICLVLILVIVYLRYMERRTLFYPYKVIECLPSEFGFSFEEAVFKSVDNKDIHGWFIPYEGATKTILFSHGNAGNISHRLEKIKILHEFGCNVFIFDYRGYGKSRGSPSENGLYKDAQAAYNYLLAKGIAPENIIGYGESIGGAVIIDLAEKNKFMALVLEGTFSNAKDMAKLVYPFIPHWIFSSRFDSLSKIRGINAPKFFIHSINDEIVPYDLSKKLYENAPGPKEFLQVRGGHNSCFFESESLIKEKAGAFIKGL